MDEKQDTESTYDGDYIVDEKAKTATLTQDGVKKAEEYFHVENLMDIDNTTLLHHIDQAIKANGVMRRGVRASSIRIESTSSTIAKTWPRCTFSSLY